MQISIQVIGKNIFMDLEDWSNGKKGEVMSAKLERLGAELTNARRKKAIWEAKVKELEVRYREEENTEIHDMVHAANLIPDQLAELLRKFSENKILQPEEIYHGCKEENTDEV